MKDNNKIIFGKDETQGITNLEVDNGFVRLWLNDKSTKTVPIKYWFLTKDKVSSKQTQLNGNQYYKYIAEFDLKEEYLDALNAVRARKKDMWCVWDDKEMAMVRYGITHYKGLKLSDISVLSFDIETTGVVKDKTSKVLAITNKYRSQSGAIVEKHFFLDEYEDDQIQMIEDWCSWVRESDPDILCGHNLFGFDLPYLEFVASKNGITLNIGREDQPIKFNQRSSNFRKDGSQTYEYNNAYVYGRDIIDTFFLSIKYDVKRQYESYALKQIIKQEGMEKKDRTFVDASKIGYYYHNDKEMWNKVKLYAMEDADDALKLFDKMAPSFFYMTQSIPRSFQHINNTATGSQINSLMVRSYLQDGHSIPKTSELEHLEGGISFAVPGLYKNVLKIDLKSAYPSQILRFKLYDQYKDPKGHFYTMVKYFTEERFQFKDMYKKTKDNYYNDRSESSKIFVNSAYGACSTPGLNFNSPKIAAKITHETREVINMALIWASGKDKEYWINEFKKRTGKADE